MMTDNCEMEEPRVARVVPLVDADRMDCQQTARVVESEVLRILRAIPGMDELRLAGRAKIQSKFEKRIAIVVNMLRVAACDVLYVHLQRRGTDHILERHRQTAQTFDLLLEVCGAPQMLEAWSYSVFQQQWLVQRLGPVVGAGNATTCQPTSAVAPRGRNVECEHLEEAPFLLPLMCALISPEFKLFPVAGLLASARRGWWTENDTVFMVDESLSSRARTGLWGQVESAPIQDMGKVTVLMHDSEVVMVRFSVSLQKLQDPRTPTSCLNSADCHWFILSVLITRWCRLQIQMWSI